MNVSKYSYNPFITVRVHKGLSLSSVQLPASPALSPVLSLSLSPSLFLYLCHLFITQKLSLCLDLSIAPLCHLYLFFLFIPAPSLAYSCFFFSSFFLWQALCLFTSLSFLSLSPSFALCFSLFLIGQRHCTGRGEALIRPCAVVPTELCDTWLMLSKSDCAFVCVWTFLHWIHIIVLFLGEAGILI